MTLIPALLLQDDAAGGVLALMGGAMMLVCLAVALILVIAVWKVFVKAGQPGWAVLVPIYNYYIMLQIAGKPAWWIVLMLIPLVNFVVAIIVYIEIAKAFGQGAGTAILMVLGIGWLMLGFGNYQYVGRNTAAAAIS